MACSVMMPVSSGGVAAGGEIERLAAGHAADPGGAREAGDELEARRRRQRLSRRGEDIEGERQQAVAGKDGGRLVERPVDRRLAAPQIVVVHRRKIVMDQRIAVHAFERRRDPQCVGRVGVEQRGALHDQQRPQPLAAIEDAVPHRREQAARTSDLAGAGARRQQPVEHRFDLGRARGEHGFEFEKRRRLTSSRAFTANRLAVKAAAGTVQTGLRLHGVGRCTSRPGPSIANG